MPHGYGAPGSPGALTPLTTDGAVHELLDRSRHAVQRFPTGWSMDDRCGQVGVGEMALMWARSSSGKSTWYLNVVNNSREVPTLVVNMEMTPRRQMEWLTAMANDLATPARDIEDVLTFGEDDNRYLPLVSALEDMPRKFPHLWFVSPSRPSVADIEVVMSDIEDSTGVRPQRVVIDHLGLMAGTEDGYSGYARVTANLKGLAMNHEVALIVLQQTGRGNGEGGRNDGHLPVKFGDGLYTGEQDADWVFGLYRPDRNPRFKKDRHQFPDPTDYYQMLDDYERVRGLTIFQTIKNRPFSDLCEQGVHLMYHPHNRRFVEIGETA